jgi:histidine ammonia-lyase
MSNVFADVVNAINNLGKIVTHEGERIQFALNFNGDKMSTATDDLKAAVAANVTAAANEIAAVITKLTSSNPDGSVTATDAEAVVTSLTAVNSTLNAETAALTAPVVVPTPVVIPPVVVPPAV